jgi:ribA/ribD-fused uncharacterized protein
MQSINLPKNKNYSVKIINTLKMSMSTSNTVYFWSEKEIPHGCFSNWYPSPFEKDGTHFKTSEHFMMYHKALLMGDKEMADLILQAKTPRKAKTLGRKVKNWDEEKWKQERCHIMRKGLLAKFEQNPELLKILIQSRYQNIAEASPYDKIWGIGLTAKQASNGAEWKGLNLLGKGLMEGRDIFLIE